MKDTLVVQYTGKMTYPGIANLIGRLATKLNECKDPMKMKFMICSVGGSADAASIFIDRVRLQRAEKKISYIETTAIGIIASCGITFAYGIADKRYITKHCIAMAHGGAIELSDKRSEERKVHDKKDKLICEGIFAGNPDLMEKMTV